MPAIPHPPRFSANNRARCCRSLEEEESIAIKRHCSPRDVAFHASVAMMQKPERQDPKTLVTPSPNALSVFLAVNKETQKRRLPGK
jgi:hypothetical protein